MQSNSLAFCTAGSVTKSNYNMLADFEKQTIDMFTQLVSNMLHTTKGTPARSTASQNYETFMKNVPKAIIPKLPIEPLIALVQHDPDQAINGPLLAQGGMRAEKLLPLIDTFDCDNAGYGISIIRTLYESGTPPAILLPSLKKLAEKFTDKTQDPKSCTTDISHKVVEIVTAMTYGTTVDPDVYGYLQEISSDPSFAFHAYKVEPALERIRQSMKLYIDGLNEALKTPCLQDTAVSLPLSNAGPSLPGGGPI